MTNACLQAPDIVPRSGTCSLPIRNDSNKTSLPSTSSGLIVKSLAIENVAGGLAQSPRALSFNFLYAIIYIPLLLMSILIIMFIIILNIFLNLF